MAHESTIFHLPGFYVHIITNVPVGENIGALAGHPLFEIKIDFLTSVTMQLCDLYSE